MRTAEVLHMRVEELEDAITEAGIILSKHETGSDPVAVIRDAMRRLGLAMNDPAVLKRQGI